MKLAIFDIDGTLTNTNSVDDECFVKALSEAHAITEINKDWATYPHTTDSGITLQIFQERFGRHPENNELDKFKSSFVNMLREQYQSNSSSFTAIASASVAFNKLKREADWCVAIATGCWRESALLKLRAAQIDIDGIPAAFAEDGLSREEILLSAVSQSLKRYRLNSFSKTVSIGDGVWDVRTARRLNFGFVGVGCGESSTLLNRAGAKHVVVDFADYDLLVRCLNEAEIPGVERLG
ncbi:MAG TPA: HAD family hydrolase [Pyrinomonadaceae bacterium]|jgi:phosphoglycolate phosphatase-like HAD superfamily hydrolase|nr:HAD family hydrolase [Pyrinomonadaceae bacterium]